MKWLLTVCFFVAALGSVSEESEGEPPSLDGLNPSQIEKMMMEQILKKPKGSGKEAVSFTKIVKPILKQFKQKLLAEKDQMQKSLDKDKQTVDGCVKKMKDSINLGLLEMDKKKKGRKGKDNKKKGKKGKDKKKCPTKKEIEKCDAKFKALGEYNEVCGDLKDVNKKDVESIFKLIKQWNKQKVLKKDCKLDKGETRYHYVTRLANHFTKKLKAFDKKIGELLKEKKHGKKLNEKCDKVQHYQKKLRFEICEKMKADKYACSCGKVLREEKICNMFHGCYKAAKKAQIDNEKSIKQKNDAAKLEWRAVGRIECLVKVMEGKNKADKKQLDKCIDPRALSTRPLKLKFRTVPKEPKCKMPGVDKNLKKMCAKGQKKR